MPSLSDPTPCLTSTTATLDEATGAVESMDAAHAAPWQLLHLTHLAEHELPLARLLQEVVQDGASIGFLPPISLAEARAYWQGVEQGLQRGDRRLWLALAPAQQGGALLGSVQLSLCGKANGSHRAEVEKLMVAPGARGHGLARALMGAMEQGAIQAQRRLLVLDTRVGDVASHLYQRLGYQAAGQIPDFAINGDGSLAATQFFYKRLSLD
jgi:acetyltransferase